MKPESVSLIIPTKNSKDLLYRQIQDLVDIAKFSIETIVVDSSDDDTTVNFLKQNLPNNTRYFSTEPGLYQAWNRAIEASTADYIYIATSGDRMNLKNFRMLHATACNLGTDITISAPNFIDEKNLYPKPEWPIHIYLKNTLLKEAKIVPTSHVIAYNLLLFPATLIGSSASNLYKASFLKKNLFPIDCGNEGDSVWAAMHSLNTTWGIQPECCSDFVIHKTTSKKYASNYDLQQHQLNIIQSSLSDHTHSTTDKAIKKKALSYIDRTRKTFELKNRFSAEYKTPLSLLRPKVWYFRRQFRRHRRFTMKMINEYKD